MAQATDADLLDCGEICRNPMIGSNTVRVTVVNNGTGSLNGIPITLQYRVGPAQSAAEQARGIPPATAGITQRIQTFVPAMLGSQGERETFAFAEPWQLDRVGHVWLEARMFPGPAGDPDADDSVTVSLTQAGLNDCFIRTRPQKFTQTNAPFYPATGGSKFQTMWTPGKLGGGGGLITAMRVHLPGLGMKAGGWPSIRVDMGETSLGTLGTVFASNYNLPSSPPARVFQGALPKQDEFIPIALSTPFSWSGEHSLLVTIYLAQPGDMWTPHTARMMQHATAGFRTLSSTGSGDSANGTLSAGEGGDITFTVIPRIARPSLLPVYVNVAGGRPGVGNNTVQASLFNRGWGVSPAPVISASYTVDGGQSWVGGETVAPAAFPAGCVIPLQFTLPWNAPSVGRTRVLVRAWYPGVPEGEGGTEFIPDADIGNLTVPGTQGLGVHSPTVTVTNNGDFSLVGQPLTLRLNGNGGTLPVFKTVFPSMLAARGSSETFAFTGAEAWVVTSAGPKTLRCDISPGLPGDPDAGDGTVVFRHMGNLGLPTGYTQPNPNRVTVQLFSDSHANLKLQTSFSPTQVGTTGEILGMRIPLSNAEAPGVIRRVRIVLAESSVPVLSTTFASNFNLPGSPPIVVYDGPLVIASVAAAEVHFDTPFNYSGANRLLVTLYTEGSDLKSGAVKGGDLIGSQLVIARDAGDAPVAEFSIADAAISSTFQTFTRIPAASLSVRDIRIGATGMGSPGLNPVTARLWNRGTAGPWTGTIGIEYSTDDGATWPSAQSESFMPPAVPANGYVDFTFQTPLLLVDASPVSVTVRIVPTPAPASGGQLSKTFHADADLLAVGTAIEPPVIGANQVRVTVVNRGSMSLAGRFLVLQYSVDRGESWQTETFNSALLGPFGSTAEFAFSVPMHVSTASIVELRARILVPLAGDPDPADEIRSQLEAGAAGAVALVRGTNAPTGSSGMSSNFYSNAKFQVHWPAAALPPGPFEITSFGLRFYQRVRENRVKRVRIEVGEVDTSLLPVPGSLHGEFAANYNVPGAGPIVVYDGEVVLRDIPARGDFRIPFSRPFAYSGQNGLLITVYREGGESPEFTMKGDLPGLTHGTQYFLGDGGDASLANLDGHHNSGFWGSLRTVPITTSPRAEILGLAVGQAGLPYPGPNALRVKLRNTGTVSLNGLPVPVELSVNGGQTWSAPANVTPTALAAFGDTQELLIPTPWTVGSWSGASLSIRVSPAFASSGTPLTVSFRPDPDLEEILPFPAVPALGTNRVGFRIRNGAASYGLGGFNLTLRYTVDGGQSWTQETFAPQALNAPGSSEFFMFGTPWQMSFPGPRTIRVEVVQQVTGDPDSAESLTLSFPHAGQTARNLDTGFTIRPGMEAGPWGTGDQNIMDRDTAKYQFTQTPEMVGGGQCMITEFGIQFNDPVPSTTWSTFRIQFGETTRTPGSQSFTSFAANYDVPWAPATVVYDGPLTVTTQAAGEPWRVALQTPYWYAGIHPLLVTIYAVHSNPPQNSTLAVRILAAGKDCPTFRQFRWGGGDAVAPANAGTANLFASFEYQTPLPMVVACSYRIGMLPGGATDHERLSTGPLAFAGMNAPWQGWVLMSFSRNLLSTGHTSRTYGIAPGWSLPPGLVLNPLTGEISGVPGPGAAGNHTVRFTLTDGYQTVFRNHTITIGVTDLPANVVRDGSLDVVDVQAVVNLILAMAAPAYPGQGDVNGDSVVDVVDVQGVVNCILLTGPCG